METTVDEAAKHLGVSRDTVMRRIRKGELDAHQEERPQGHVWRVVIPDEKEESSKVDGEVLARELESMRGVLELVQGELATKNEQIKELHILLQQAQAALPAPQENRRSWWRLW